MTDVMEAPAFRIDLVNLCLWRRNSAGTEDRVNLTPKSFDVLRFLADNPGRLVSQEELLKAVWSDVYVQPEVIKSQILAIRTALGDKGASSRFIETQRGRGYRFVGEMSGVTSAAHERSVPLELGVFAGRTEALRQLLDLLHRGATGDRQAVFISGEPGIGKTTLVEHFIGQLRGHPDLAVARGYCIEGFAGVEPYAPVFEALRGLCNGPDRTRVTRALSELAPTWANQMPDQISGVQRTDLKQRVIFDTVGRMAWEATCLFEGLASERPLLLVLEDLHWTDFATIDFISALIRRRSAARLMLIGTYRLADLKTAASPLRQVTRDLALHKYCIEMNLASLSTTEITEIISGKSLEASSVSEFARLIEDRTGGNPLFMRATLEFLTERGEVSHTAQGWEPLVPFTEFVSDTPPSLTSAIEARIEGLTDEENRVLEAASVAGNRFDPVTTARAAGLDEQTFESICERFTSSVLRHDKLLTLPDNQLVRTYTFNHAVYRQVVYGRIGLVRRAYLHRMLAERLEEIYPEDQRNDLAIRLAEHFALARDWSRALDYLRSALRVASIRFSRNDTFAILDRAFDLAAHLPDSVRIAAELEFLEQRATIQAAARDPRAQETFQEFVARARQHGDVSILCRALLGLAYTTNWHDLAFSQQALEEVLVLCEKQTDPILGDVTRLAAYARRLLGLGWNRDIAGQCEEAFMRLMESNDQVAIARAQLSFSMICLVSSRHREVRDLVESSYKVLSDSSQSPVEIVLATAIWMRYSAEPWSLLYLGEYGLAQKELENSIAAFSREGDLSAVRSFQIERGAFRFHALDFEGALRDCESVTTHPIADATGQVLPHYRRIALIHRGLAKTGLGDNAGALADFSMAEEEMGRQPAYLDWYWRLPLEWGMVNALIEQGDHNESLARATHLSQAAMDTDDRTWRALAWEARARAALSCGEALEALEHVVRALNECEAATIPVAEWRVRATAAAIFKAKGDLREASKHVDLGLAVTRRLAESMPAADPLRSTFERRSALHLGV
jgi:DNA-binding winged helix-turn-helix (wHTH) protein/tetratricopeptide (TPR) repeat protein